MELASYDRLRAEDHRKIDRVCDQFEQALQTVSRPLIEDYLLVLDGYLRPHLFRQLLLLELEFSGRLGERPAIDKYESRFPELAMVIDQVFAELLKESNSQARVEDTDGVTTIKTDVALCDSTDDRELGDELIGKTIHNYQLEEKLGEGGMGQVYRATHTMLGCQRAVKIIVPRIAANDHIVRRFREEAKAISLLSHQNIVSLYDFGEHEGMLYLVLELLEGEDLGTRVKHFGPLGISDSVELIRQAAAGLAMQDVPFYTLQVRNSTL